MAQHDYVISNGTGAAVRSDLNNALLAIVSQNSGATEPTTTYAYQWWADTTTGLLKIRNSANNAWITLRELDGTLTVEDGTVSAPGLAFRDDLNTGIWRPGTDQFAISTNGVERVEWGTSEVVFNDGGTNYDFRVEGDTNANLLFVDASADAVGIGTSSPATALHVSGSGTQRIRITGTGAANAILSLDAPSTYANYIEYGLTASTPLRFYDVAATADRMIIDTSGRVGIGTTNPATLLHLRTTGTPILRIQDDDGTTQYSDFYNSAGQTYYNAVNGAGVRGAHVFLQAGTEAARIDSSGRLLVGTSSSVSVATLESDQQIFGSAPQLSITRGSNNANGATLALAKSRNTAYGSRTIVTDGDTLGSIRFCGDDGVDLNSIGAQIYAQVDGTPGSDDLPTRLVFSTTPDSASSPVERLRIENNGRAGFGVTASAMTTHPANLGVLGGTLSANDALIHGAMSNSGSSDRFFLILSSNYASSRDTEFRLQNNGDAFADGSWTGGGADYAEYFEWSDSNPDTEDRRGISVVLDGNKIREAVAGEDPIGVISGNPSVVGDAAWNKWSGKYLRDEFGTYILEDYEVNDEDGNTVVQQRRKLNPAFDTDAEYIPREQRPEWDCVGLMGKLRIRKGQVTGSRWIKMRDISDSIEEWLVR